jgi:hypothetical protein
VAAAPTRRTPRDAALAAEALLLLIAARRMVRTAGLRGISARLEALPDARGAHDAAVCADIVWAVGAAARRMPLRLLCYERGIAACHMLSRRGLAATFHYGVGRDDGDLAAHVWVTSGPLPVIGCAEAADYRVVLRVSR